MVLTDEQTGPKPENYKSIIRAAIPGIFKDPSSVQQTSVTPPRRDKKGWSVCLFANAKNAYGGYTGIRATEVIIKNGRIADVTDISDPDFGRRMDDTIQQLCNEVARLSSREPL